MRKLVRPVAAVTFACLAFAPGIARADVATPDADTDAASDSTAAPGSPAPLSGAPDSVSVASDIETEVAFDRAGRITRLEPALAKAVGLLDAHPGFQEARLLERADSTYVLEVTTLDRGHLVRQRQRLSRAQVDALRDRVEQAAASGTSVSRRDDHGRPLFVTISTVMGLGFYGWAIPVLAEVENPEEFAGFYLLTAGASTILPMLATDGGSVSDGAAILWTYGLTRGTLHGALVPYLSDENPDGRVQLGWALGLSLAEGVAGFSFARASHMRAGSAGTYVTGGDFGMLYGAGFADLANSDHSGTTAALLVGSAVGLAGARVLDARRDYSYGDGAVMRMAGWVGAFTAASVASFSRGEEKHNTEVSSAMVGGVVGLAVGDRVVHGAEFTFGQSVVIDLTTVGVGLMGLGVGLLLTSDQSDDNRNATQATASAIGSMLGFALGVSIENAQARAANADRSSWRLELSPTPPLARGDAPGLRLALSAAIPAAR